MVIMKMCLTCGEKFVARECMVRKGYGNYCSRECFFESLKLDIPRTCKFCGKQFNTKLSRIKSGRGIYCSRVCQYQARRAKEKRICLYCGKEFETHKAEIKKGNAKYCSVDCANNDKMNRTELKCKVCGKTFIVLKSKSKKRTCCSWECGRKARSNTVKKNGSYAKSNNPCWKGGISYGPYCPEFNESLKERIREEFGRKCFLCGVPENGTKLCVHHVDYQKSQGCKGQRWSLLPLCKHHHAKTNHNRWYWFALLRDYWIYEYLEFDLYVTH
jgi:hypothetical protein